MTDSAKHPPLSREEMEAHDRLLRARADRFANDLRGVGMQEGGPPAPCSHSAMRFRARFDSPNSAIPSVDKVCTFCGMVFAVAPGEVSFGQPDMPTKAQIDRMVGALLSPRTRGPGPFIVVSEDGQEDWVFPDGIRAALYRAAGIEGEA